MAKKTEEEIVRDWHSRIAISHNLRERWANAFRWREFEQEYEGRFDLERIAVDPKLAIPPINLVFAYVKTEIASLSLKDPHFEVNAKKDSTILSAKIRELAINYIWRQKRMKRESKKCLQDGKTVGHAWYKVGYTGEFGTIEDGSGHVTEFIENEDFFGYRVPWDNVLFNVDAIDPPHDCRWIAHEFLRPFEDVKKNPRFSNREDIKPTVMVSPDSLEHGDGALEPAATQSFSPNMDSNITDPSLQKVRMWEIWDITQKKVMTIAEGMDKWLEKPKDWPYDLSGFPFSFLGFNPVNDRPYPVPDIWQFEPQVMELIKIRAMQLDHLKRFNRQIEVQRGALSEEQKQNLALGLTGNIVESDQFGRIQPIAYPPIQADIYAVEERVKEDMINVSGQSPLERGASAKTTTRTIGELLQIQRGAHNRRGEQLDTYEDFLEDVARNMISLLMQFADVPFYVKLTGDEPQDVMQQLATRPSAQNEGAITSPDGFTFTREDIQGEFDIDVKVGSTIPLDRENKIAIIQSLLESLPKLGINAQSPVVGALGQILVDELDMPEVSVAIEQHRQLMARQRQEAEARLQEAREIDAAKFGVESQLEADKIQGNQTGEILNALTAAINRGQGPGGL